MNISYQATPLGKNKFSREGLPAVELFPWAPANFPGQKPPHHQRHDVRVVTTAGTYRGGIRIYPTDGKDAVYLCPDLKLDGVKVSLAKVLSNICVKPGETVNVNITGNTWRVNC